jgi:hypothetical protein
MKRWEPLRALGAAAAFTLFGGPVFAETAQMTPEIGNTNADRNFFTEVHLPGEISAGEVDLGFLGGAVSSWNGDTYNNSLWLFPYSDMGTDARYWHDGGTYEYSNNNGTVESDYYFGEDGSLQAIFHSVGDPGTGVMYRYKYESDGRVYPPYVYSYYYEYYDANDEGAYFSSDAPFDADALLASIKGDIPVSRYGIFDFDNSWIDYEGDGLGPISLAQLLETDVYGKYYAYFNNGAVDALDWESAFPIASVEIAYQPVPEPETWGMLLSGLGLVGFIARRRRKHV